jgi:AraC-type DNA-binding domain-containing proteins
MERNDYNKAFFDLTKNPNTILRLSSSFETGSVNITAYCIASGLFLSLNEASGESIPFDDKQYSYKLTTINQCISGRCEFRHPGEAVSYISPQLTCIARKHKMDAFHYPLGYYTGLEISIIEELIDHQTKQFLNHFSIDINLLLNRYLRDTETYIGRTDTALLSLFNELYDFIKKDNIGQIRLKVLEVLSHFQHEEILVPVNSHYITSVQAGLARRVHSILTADLSRHIAMKDISSEMDVSETSLKNYFKEVYGSCISDYMKNKRMKYAADKLQNTSLSILDIANSVGYTNQGRFAKVFYDYYNMNPLEYRRKSKTTP